ncbi:unnamed protein product [Rotaria sp. Silwood1]|nr:unnamed protein product [Rotaria sp. Silwood1]CAF1070368.1 unnamed protein product [Rotaria sp. Silwood1]CAF3416116.1 unnamed protein product [Rotaria sp. Silwood1]CAF4637193.1 unnamed protein product [Rotaria sp. Silwood1]CAF4695794.1 unnamed protein product [Rotaria sp. Silwood1]
MSNQTFLIGTGGKTIYACRLTHDGQLLPLHENKSGQGPSWLLAQDDLLYAANEHDDKIEIFTIDDSIQGRLTSKNIISSQGSTPCSLDIDSTGKWLAVANYGGNGSSNFVLLPLNKSNIPEENNAQIVSIDGHGPNHDRQSHSHCHQVKFYQNNLYVIDLGTDTINVYHYDDTNGQAHLHCDRIKTQPGAGPRHILFHPDKSLAFVTNELDSTTNVYQIDSMIGKFEHLQTITTRRKNDEKENSPAELQLTPDKKYLLVSNRGDENIVIYNLNDNNNNNNQVLSIKGYLDIHGSGPRYFTFDPTGHFLLVANQNSNNLICFSYNRNKDTFEFISQLVNIESPQHIVFIS